MTMDECSDFTPHNSSISSSTHELDTNINNIISSLDSDFDFSNPNQNRIMNSVIAYVEVRSGNENRGKGVTEVLRQLGAEIRMKFTTDVTHVIFKEGTKRTVERAKKKGVKIVSVLWVDSCRENRQLVPETEFLYHETGATPQYRKLKKQRSMQPKDYEEDLANSSERWKKTYQKRIEERKKEQPLWKNIYVPDSQPDFNFLMGPGSPNLSIPDTPPSMKRKRAELLKKELAKTSTKLIEESPSSQSVFPDVNARLFKYDVPPKYDPELIDTSQVIHSSCESTASKTICSPSAITGSTIPVRFGCSPSDNSESVSSHINVTPTQTSHESSSLTLRISPSPKSFDTVIDTQDLLDTAENYNGPTNHETDNDADKIIISKSNDGLLSTGTSVSDLPPNTVNKTVKKKRKLLRKSICEPIETLISPKVSSNLAQTKPTIVPLAKGKSQEKDKNLYGGKSSISKRKHSSAGDIQSVDQNLKKKRKTINGACITHIDIDRSQDQPMIPDSSTSADRVKNTRRRSTIPKSINKEVSRQDTLENLNIIDKSVIVHKKSINATSPVTRTVASPSGDFQIAENLSSSSNLGNIRRSLVTPDKIDTPDDKVKRRRSTRKSILNSDSIQEMSNNTDDDKIEKRRSIRTSVNSLNELSTTLNSPSVPTQSTPRGSSRQSISSLSISNISTPTRLSTGNDSAVMTRENSEPEKTKTTEKKSRRKSSRLSTVLGFVPECSTFPAGSNIVQTVLTERKNIINRTPMTPLHERSSVLENLLSANKRQSVDEFSARKNITARRLKRFESYSTAFSDSDSNEDMTKKKIQLKNARNKMKKQNIENVNVDGKMLKRTASKRSVTNNRSNSSSKLPPIPTIVMTSLHKSERDIVQSVVKKLGGLTLVPSVDATTTHVVSGKGRRTLNVLNAIARGCWLLSAEWVYKSLEAEKWLPEEEYQQTDCFPSCKVSHHERSLSDNVYQPQIFTDCGSIFIAETCAPPRHSIVNLVKICGGMVTGSWRNAEICVGIIRKSITSVSEQWILDSIMALKALSLENYDLQTVNRETRESSPEW